MVSAVSVAVAVADAAEATLLLAFVGHGEAYKNDLYLLPTNGTSPASMFTGFLFGQGLAELVRTVSGLDGLIVLVDACQSGAGVADLAQRASAEISAAGLRVQLVTSTFDQAARDGCFTRTLTRLLRDGAPGLSRDYLLAENDLLALIAGTCKAQEPPRTAMFQGPAAGQRPGAVSGPEPAAGQAWALAGTAAGEAGSSRRGDFQVTDAWARVVDAWRYSTGSSSCRGVRGSGNLARGRGVGDARKAAPVYPRAGAHGRRWRSRRPVSMWSGWLKSLGAQLARLPGFPAAAGSTTAMFRARRSGRSRTPLTPPGCWAVAAPAGRGRSAGAARG